MLSALKLLNKELEHLGLALALLKCSLFAVTKHATLSPCKLEFKDVKFVSEESVDYLGGTCKLEKGLPTWTSDELLPKAEERLANKKSKNLKLNTITTTTMSKIVSLPRYSCGFGGANLKDLQRLDVLVAEHLRTSVGLDNMTSKTVIYGSKAEGGLGLTMPSYLYTIEPVCTALRMFNSTSTITSNIALAAWNHQLNDPFWNTVKETVSSLNWSLQTIDNTYQFVNQYGNVVCPRTELLFHYRSKESIKPSSMGKLDLANSWHPITTSFWNNHKLNHFHQRMLFAQLHHTQILAPRGNKLNKKYPSCHVCNKKATWEHVFSECIMCKSELSLLYKKWNESSAKHNTAEVKLPPDHSPLTINMDWNGVIHNNPNFQFNKLLTEWSTDIYCAFASYVGSCYKNSTWNSCSQLRNKRGYMIKPKTAKFSTAWDLSRNSLSNLINTSLYFLSKR
ncbi:predicted protein [Naegleria gruberi]|uniref:Predicted protein n=1 Tax=Naegleria gruberi TaxID=5762 RepID=D2W5F8_NAEGR|nr:uncharacterized protein NAEGRDRAFT_54794 [Naegleria gruberi]EFC35694.1 predicted protein [Naegleria gruberi]|eukprot:XP_002668438.1 predicted protein [Naegleria gruberi strain NEG-M]